VDAIIFATLSPGLFFFPGLRPLLFQKNFFAPRKMWLLWDVRNQCSGISLQPFVGTPGLDQADVQVRELVVGANRPQTVALISLSRRTGLFFQFFLGMEQVLVVIEPWFLEGEASL